MSTKEFFKPYVDLVIRTTTTFPTQGNFIEVLKAVFNDRDAYQIEQPKIHKLRIMKLRLC